MITILRAGIRLILFFLFSLLTVLLVGVGNLLLKPFSAKWTINWKNGVIQLWARLTSRVINMRIRVNGTPPEPPFFLVTNHLSYIDVLPLWTCAKGTFIAKSEIKSWPFFGWGTKTLGVIFIDRNLRRDVQRVNKLIASAVSDWQGVIIFPEGTSTKGVEVKPFHPSLLHYPVETEMSVSYATLSYRSNDPRRPASHYICWWGDMPFFNHFWELLKLPGFESVITFGEERIAASDRKELADQLWKHVQADFIPVAEVPDRLKQSNMS